MTYAAIKEAREIADRKVATLAAAVKMSAERAAARKAAEAASVVQQKQNENKR